MAEFLPLGDGLECAPAFLTQRGVCSLLRDPRALLPPELVNRWPVSFPPASARVRHTGDPKLQGDAGAHGASLPLNQAQRAPILSPRLPQPGSSQSSLAPSPGAYSAQIGRGRAARRGRPPRPSHLPCLTLHVPTCSSTSVSHLAVDPLGHVTIPRWCLGGGVPAKMSASYSTCEQAGLPQTPPE